MTPARIHHLIEHNAGALIFGILFIAMLGGLAQILPVLGGKSPEGTARPYTALALAGREVYIRESCGLCHTQHVRPLVAEVLRYGNYSQASEFVYDRPFLWGSKRTGPDLHRLAGKYSDLWHRLHLRAPRAVVPGSIMPAYAFLEENEVDVTQMQKLMLRLRWVGIEYSDDDIRAAGKTLQGKTEMDAIIAYLQSLGENPPPMDSGDAHGSGQ